MGGARMIDEQFVYLAALINCIAGVRYIMDTVRVRVRPNPVSWGLWAATGWLAFGGQLDEGVGLPALLTLTVAVVPTLILLVASSSRSARTRRSRTAAGRRDIGKARSSG